MSSITEVISPQVPQVEERKYCTMLSRVMDALFCFFFYELIRIQYKDFLQHFFYIYPIKIGRLFFVVFQLSFVG